jgi:hypothetical protein
MSSRLDPYFATCLFGLLLLASYAAGNRDSSEESLIFPFILD